MPLSPAIVKALRKAREATNTTPTEAQAHAGNYAKGRVNLHGLNIAIENPKGSIRRGKDCNGRAWERRMKADYGYFTRTKAVDGDAVDCFIGPKVDSEFVVAIDQYKGKEFDETKFVLGVTSREEGEQLYLSHYPRGWELGPVSTTTVAQLKKWLKEGNTKAPFKDQLVKAASTEEVTREVSNSLLNTKKLKDIKGDHLSLRQLLTRHPARAIHPGARLEKSANISSIGRLLRRVRGAKSENAKPILDRLEEFFKSDTGRNTPYILGGTGEAFLGALKGSRGRRSALEGLLSGGTTAAVSSGADWAADGELDHKGLTATLAALAGVTPAAVRGTRLARRNLKRNMALMNRLNSAGFVESGQFERLGDLLQNLRAGKGSRRDILKEMLKTVRSGKKELRVDLLSNENVPARKIHKALTDANRRLGVTDIDAGFIINPGIAYGVMEDGQSIARRLARTGFSRLHGSAYGNRTRTVPKEVADTVWNMVAGPYGKAGWRDQNLIPAWSDLTRAEKQWFRKNNIRDARDYDELTQLAHQHADHFYSGFRARDLKKDPKGLVAPQLKPGVKANTRPSIRRYFDPRGDEAEFDIDLKALLAKGD